MCALKGKINYLEKSYHHHKAQSTGSVFKCMVWSKSQVSK